MLKKLFHRIITRFSSGTHITDKSLFMHCLIVLVNVFQQNRSKLSHYEAEINKILLNYYQNMMKTKKKLPENLIKFMYEEKIKKNIYLNLKINKH
jgi:hypothetical protein